MTWRLTLHERQYPAPGAAGTRVVDTLITELPDARGKRLETAWDAAASFTFTLNGGAPAAAEIRELEHEVIAWRADEAGVERPMFRGIVGQSEDQITEQEHVVIFTAHDAISMLGRRYVLADWNPTATDQDDIVSGLVSRAIDVAYMQPGSYLPLNVVRVNPDGSARPALSGRVRDRNYPNMTEIGTALDDLAKVIDGFDYDVQPCYDGARDALRIFYDPASLRNQGVLRDDPVLMYGSSIATCTRTVNSAQYGNFVRTVGGQDANGVTMTAQAFNADASGIRVGLWEWSDNVSDVTIQSTLDQKAQGDLASYGVLVPSYTLGLRPGFYEPGLFNMGDALRLIIKRGRLDVDTDVRVLGINYSIADDEAGEDVEVVVGRSVQTLGDILDATRADVDALARR